MIITTTSNTQTFTITSYKVNRKIETLSQRERLHTLWMALKTLIGKKKLIDLGDYKYEWGVYWWTALNGEREE